MGQTGDKNTKNTKNTWNVMSRLHVTETWVVIGCWGRRTGVSLRRDGVGRRKSPRQDAGKMNAK